MINVLTEPVASPEVTPTGHSVVLDDGVDFLPRLDSAGADAKGPDNFSSRSRAFRAGWKTSCATFDFAA
jgi:hypothetical protein